MIFSEHFGIERTTEDDWFDPFLVIDTPLFVDPFLIYANEEGFFVGSHQEIIDYFNCMFRLIIQAGCDPRSQLYQKAVNDLLLPEVEELCLGYTTGGTKGSGSGREIAKVMAAAIAEAVNNGVTQIRHLEEISILREGVGADRISDAAANILRRRLVWYTENVCRRHGVEVAEIQYRRGYYDSTHLRWMPIRANLPVNPRSKKRKPVLLVPKRYLNSLPTINPEDFWTYCYDNENEILRQEFNYDVTSRISKAEIIRLAREHPELRERYIEHVEKTEGKPYDLGRDRKGLVSWYPPIRDFCRENPLAFQILNQDHFVASIEQMLEKYRHFMEEKGGWRLLWDDGRSKPEKAVQLTLLGVLQGYCEANDIDISPEADVGRGPVDFKMSRGFRLRVLIEVKLARNTAFWRGLRVQLPTYLKCEKATRGYFRSNLLRERPTAAPGHPGGCRSS